MRPITTSLLLPLLLCGCKTKPLATPKPWVITTSIQPASITINPDTHWSAAPTDAHMPVYTDIDPVIQFFPIALRGSLIIQRPAGAHPDTGFLNGKVSVPTAATLYIALRTTRHTPLEDAVLITHAQLAAFAKEGWSPIPGIFSITEPPGDFSQWQVWSHLLDPGPITLTSKAIPDGGLFFIGRRRPPAPTPQ